MLNQHIRALKALVIFLGLVIVIGTGIVVFTIAGRIGDARREGAQRAADVDLGAIALPAGARVLEIDLDGDRLALRIGLADGSEQIAVFDVRTGQRLSTLAVPP